MRFTWTPRGAESVALSGLSNLHIRLYAALIAPLLDFVGLCTCRRRVDKTRNRADRRSSSRKYRIATIMPRYAISAISLHRDFLYRYFLPARDLAAILSARETLRCATNQALRREKIAKWKIAFVLC